ncbi:MAG: hypothetical protein RLZZ290_1642, partial [Pseudomonadota bacterium]
IIYKTMFYGYKNPFEPGIVNKCRQRLLTNDLKFALGFRAS